MNNNLLNELKNQALVYDTETSSHYPDGRPINLRTNYEDYINYGQIKWFGCYSYKTNKQYYLNPKKDLQQIFNLLESHSILIGFNSEDFDFPILVNNGFTSKSIKYLSVDCMQVLGSNTSKNREGFAYKNRGELMNYDFKRNSLEHMAEGMKLDFQKGKIDFKIFEKDEWTEIEEKEIKKYLQNDVMATKQMFDKLWDYWKPFTELLSEKEIKNLSWIRSSIASLTYKSACYFMGEEPTYSEQSSKIEEMGGRVLLPKYEEINNVWYVDFASLYPHIFCMFNLFAEKDPQKFDNLWHGNEFFKVKGYYDISNPHILAGHVSKLLKQRIELKEKDKNNPMVYCLKIFLNGLYGVIRSSIFEKVHTPNAGWDCCWLGQQIHEFVEKQMMDYGFEIVQGDTDSIFCKALDKKNNNLEYVQKCLNEIVMIINDNVPFPIDTFKLNIETYIDYLMCPFSEQSIIDEETGKNKKKGNRLVKERKGVKKNYLYIYKNKEEKSDVKLVGLPIIKSNATKLGIKIYEEILKPKILEKKSAKFSREFIDNILNEYLKREDILKLLAREFKVNPAKSYKLQSQIQAQISTIYFEDQSGSIELIKNKKIGKVGKGDLYCTIKEAIENKLTYKDIDLEKVYHELEPFIEFEFWVKNTETDMEYLVTKDAYEANKDFLEIIEPKKKFDKSKSSNLLKTKKIKKNNGSIDSEKKKTVSDILSLK